MRSRTSPRPFTYDIRVEQVRSDVLLVLTTTKIKYILDINDKRLSTIFEIEYTQFINVKKKCDCKGII